MNEFLRVLIRYVGCLYMLLILVQYGRFFLFQERRGEKGLDEGVEWRQTAETNAAEGWTENAVEWQRALLRIGYLI